MAMTEAKSVSALQTVGGVTEGEWRVAREGNANLLLAGPDLVVEAIIDALQPHFRQPVEVWSPASRLILPQVGGTGTLILRDVGAMPRDDQRKLCDWLEATAGTTRVVSTSQQPLLRLLEAGAFAETLYYRLNVLCFQLTECDDERILHANMRASHRHERN
jgi:hypothetical protein